MREHDEAALELRVRQVLADRLGSLSLDLTAEALERRRAARDQARRRRRALLGLGLAAALVLPAGWLAAGAPLPEPRQPALVVTTQTVAVPTPTDQRAESTATPSATPTGTDLAIFLRPTDDAAGGLDVIAVRRDGKERRIRHLDAGLTDPGSGGPFGYVERDGWLAVDVSIDSRQGTFALIDLNDPTVTPRLVSYTPVVGGAWSGSGWFATITPRTDSGFSIDVVDARSGTTRTLGPTSLPGGGPSIFWAADGSGIVTTAGGRIGVEPKDGGPIETGVGALTDALGARWMGPGGATVSICNPPDCPADTVTVHDTLGHDVVWYQGAVAGTHAADASFADDGATLWLVLEKVVDGRHQALLAHVLHPGDATPEIVSSTADLGPDVQGIWFAGLSRDGTGLAAVNSWIGKKGREVFADAPTVIVPGNGLAPTRHAGGFAGFIPSALANAWAPETSFGPPHEPAIPTAPPAGATPAP